MQICLRITMFTMQIFGTLRLKITGLEFIPKEPAIFVANHGSLMDPLLLLTVLSNTAIVFKSLYSKFFALWIFVRFLDFVSVDKDSFESLKKAKDECQKLIDKNKSIIIFPEGTRSKSGKLGDFKNLAFKIAYANNIKLVCISILHEGTLLTKNKNSIIPLRTDYFHINFQEALLPQNFKDEDYLANTAHRNISKDLRRLKEIKH